MIADAAIDRVVASLVRAELPLLYLLLDADDRVVESNRHSGELFEGPVEGRPFADLLVTFEAGVSPFALTACGPAQRTVNLRTFTGLPLTMTCCFTRVGDRVVVVGGVDPRAQESLRSDLLKRTQELAVRTRELQKSNVELERLGALKNQFLGMAAHDLRSPLLAIAGLGRMLAEQLEGRLGEVERTSLEELLASAAQMRHIIDGFLDVSQIEAGHLALKLEPVSVGELAEDAARHVRRIHRRDVAIRVARPDEDCSIPLDRSKMTQVFVNLLSNAVEHSPAGGGVVIDVRGESAGCAVRVRDHGAGLAPGVDAFAAFGRSDAERATGGTRIGLGLTIARLIVDAHGGRISLESVPGKGTTVTVRLPA